MRISDWSSDVCSSDLHGRVSVTACATRCSVLRSSYRKRNNLTLRNWANRRRCAVCHHCSEMSANYQAAPALPRQRSHSLTVWNQTCPPPNSRNLTQRRSEEHTSELQSLMRISYAVFCLKKKNQTTRTINSQTLSTEKQCSKVTHQY